MSNKTPFRVCGIVRACAEPELRAVTTANGDTHVCTIRGAVDNAGQLDDMKIPKSGFWDFISWGPSAVSAAGVITKGMQFLFHGAPQLQEWDADGVRHSRTVFVGEVVFLDKKTPSEDAHLNELPPVGATYTPTTSPADDDIPF